MFGSGTELGSYLIDTVLGTTPNQRDIPVAIGELLAAYLVQQTKLYVPGCGGESVVITIRQEGIPQFLDWEQAEDKQVAMARAIQAFWDAVVGGFEEPPKRQAEVAKRLALWLSYLQPRDKRSRR
jgi:hypothetical protein